LLQIATPGRSVNDLENHPVGWRLFGTICAGSAAPAEDAAMNQSRDYALLFRAYALTLLGSGVAAVALTLIAYDFAGEDAAGVIGVALAIKAAAYVLIAPLAAALTDRLPKRALMIGLDLAAAAVLATLPWVTAVWQIYLVIFVFTASSAVFIPTYQTLVPRLLPDGDAYGRALSKSRIAVVLENAASPLAAAALLLVLDYRGLFLFSAAAFLASAAALGRMRLPAVPELSHEGLGRALLRGPRLFAALPALRFLVPLTLGVAMTTAVVLVNTVVLVRGTFGLDALATAVALAAFGLGTVAGAIAMLPLMPRLGAQRTMTTGGLLTVAGLAAGVTLTSFAGLVALWLVLGFGTGLALTPAPAVVKAEAAEADRSLLYASYFALNNLALLVAYPLAGWIGTEIEPKVAFLLLATFAGLSLLGSLRAGRSAPA
jgi:MFS family permease